MVSKSDQHTINLAIHYSIGRIIRTKIRRKFVLINQAFELKGQFNIDCQWCDSGANYWEVQISEGPILHATVYLKFFCNFLNRFLAVLILLFLLISRRRKDKMLLEVDAADDIRENVVFYDEEGAGMLFIYPD